MLSGGTFGSPAAIMGTARPSPSMTTTETYLDHASATPLSELARQALLSALDAFGDPLRLLWTQIRWR